MGQWRNLHYTGYRYLTRKPDGTMGYWPPSTLIATENTSLIPGLSKVRFWFMWKTKQGMLGWYLHTWNWWLNPRSFAFVGISEFDMAYEAYSGHAKSRRGWRWWRPTWGGWRENKISLLNIKSREISFYKQITFILLWVDTSIWITWVYTSGLHFPGFAASWHH